MDNKSAEALRNMVAMQGVALIAVLNALKKQPGFNLDKFTADISSALLNHQTNSETKPEGVSAASSDDYVLLRAMLSKALPGLPIR